MLAFGDWHFVESDSLSYFSSRVDISLKELNSFFFKKRLLEGFQVALIFLLDCICEGFFSAERKCNLSVELRKLGVLNDYFLKVNVLELIGLSWYPLKELIGSFGFGFGEYAIIELKPLNDLLLLMPLWYVEEKYFYMFLIDISINYVKNNKMLLDS